MAIANIFAVQNMGKMLNNDFFSDVVFILNDENGDEKLISAHKLVLSSISPVFNDMFCSKLKTTGNDYRIKEVSAESFTEFIQLFYQSKVNLTIGNIREVLYLIEKYQVPACRETVELFLRTIVSTENVCALYESATSLQLSKSLLKVFQSVIEDYARKVFDSSSFLSIDEKTLIEILKFDRLNCRETIVFNATIAWATHRLVRIGLKPEINGIKRELRNVIRFIRFPTMTTTEFARVLETYPKILEWKVFSDIFCYIGDKRPLTAAKGFNVQRRYGCGESNHNPGQFSRFWFGRVFRRLRNSITRTAKSSNGGESLW